MSFETIFHYFIHIIQLCNSPEEKICMSKFYKIPKSMSWVQKCTINCSNFMLFIIKVNQKKIRSWLLSNNKILLSVKK